MDAVKTIDGLLKKWGHSIVDYSPKIILACIVMFGFYVFGRFSKRIGLRFYSKFFKNESYEIVKIISNVICVFLILSGVFLALEVLGLESVLTKLLAGAGIVGIVAGFAFKDIASNAFAGFLLNVQHPFKTGDWVTIDDTFGTIEKIGWITISVKTISGQQVFVPNQLIYNNTFINYSTYNKRRVILKSGVSYGDDLDHVEKVALDEVQKIDVLLKNEVIDFYFTSIGSSSYNFEVRFWITFTHQKDYLKAMSETIKRIKKRFEAEDISLAYAVTTLDFGVKGGVNIFDKPIITETKA